MNHDMIFYADILKATNFSRDLEEVMNHLSKDASLRLKDIGKLLDKEPVALVENVINDMESAGFIYTYSSHYEILPRGKDFLDGKSVLSSSLPVTVHSKPEFSSQGFVKEYKKEIGGYLATVVWESSDSNLPECVEVDGTSKKARFFFNPDDYHHYCICSSAL